MTIRCLLLLAAGLFVLPASWSSADEKPTQPVPLACNTSEDDDEPHIASSGLVLYFACKNGDSFDILVSTRRTATQPWSRGTVAELVDQITTKKADEKGIFVTPEGVFPQYAYFATNKGAKKPNFDIYVAMRLDRGKVFSSPTPINPINTEEDEAHPWLSADGRTLYFSRKTSAGWRVYFSTRNNPKTAAGFGEPKAIEELPAGFHHATLTRDGRTMYLQGPLEKNRWGLFVSVKSNNGKWGNPEPLAINSPDAPTGEVSPCLSRDGSILYFASDRPGGKGKLDLYAIPTAKLKKTGK